MTAYDSPFLVATLGTDNHVFDRCIDWLDRWLAQHPGVEALVQHGYSVAPQHGSAVTLLPRQELIERMSTASIVVAHGGTGSIMDARSGGQVPVVVPRLAALHECVDDHQLHFCRRLADTGWIHLAETEAELHRHLDRALEDAAAYRGAATPATTVPASTRMADVLAVTMRGPAKPIHMQRLRHLARFALRSGDGQRRAGKRARR